MRINPKSKYHGLPCSYVATGCAYEQIYQVMFNAELPDNLKNDGYLELDDVNKFIRRFFEVRKKQYFKRGERPVLKDFLSDNNDMCIICVYGHLIYVDGKDYWSFFENGNDEIVCIWFLAT